MSNSSTQHIKCAMAIKQCFLKLEPTYDNDDTANANFRSLFEAYAVLYSFFDTCPLVANRWMSETRQRSSSEFAHLKAKGKKAACCN